MRVWKTSRWLLLFPLLLMGCTLPSRRAPVEPPPASPLWTPIPIGSGVQIPPTVTPTPGATFTPRPRNTPVPTSSARWTPVVPVRPGPVIYAPRVLSPPTIDGDLGEWSFMTPISINNITYGTGAYRGPQDLSGLLYVAWDDTHLYLAFQVTDDQFVQQASGRYLYRGDSTEILVDTNLLGDQNARVLNLDDRWARTRRSGSGIPGVWSAGRRRCASRPCPGPTGIKLRWPCPGAPWGCILRRGCGWGSTRPSPTTTRRGPRCSNPWPPPAPSAG